MTKKKDTTTLIGPPQALVARIRHLETLLENLPDSISLNPASSSYDFVLNDKKLEDCDIFGALSHIFEICFSTFCNPNIHFTKHGERLCNLIKLIRSSVKTMSAWESDWLAFQSAWLEWLITAAIWDGAKIPTKKRKETASTNPLSAIEPVATAEPATKRHRLIEASPDTNSESDIEIIDRPAKNVPSISTQPTCSDPPLAEMAIRIIDVSLALIQVPASLKQGSLLGLWKKQKDLTEEEHKVADKIPAVSQAKDEVRRQ